MDFKNEFETLKRKQQYLDAELKKLEADVKAATAFTMAFLKKCGKHKLTRVAINVADKSVPESVSFPFGPQGSVFAQGQTKDGWPAIWRATEEAGISGGCGNHNQHSITHEAQAKLIDGVYELKDGKWRKVGSEQRA